MKTKVYLAAVGLVVMATAVSAQQTATKTPAPTDTIHATAQEVLLDVVARDKKGKSVRDLTKDDFHITDNGAAVKVTGFHLVQGGEAGAAEAAAAAAKDVNHIDPLKQIRLVTFVFDKLGQQGRLLARQAAMDLIKGEPEQNVYYSVFTITEQLNALQPFTNNRDLLKHAIDHGTSGASTEYAADSKRVQDQLERMLGATAGTNGQSTAELVQQAGGGNTAGANAKPTTDFAAQKMAELLLNVLQANQSFATEAGRSSLFALLALVKEQYRMPGRKTVMYFSDGLMVPPEMDEAFKSIIAYANRSNVSIYSVDSRGLQTTGDTGSGVDALSGAVAASRRQQTTTGAVTREEAQVMDTAEYSMRANVQNSLDKLATSTGGVFISNTNDLRGPLRRVDEDINTYYEITYIPDIKDYNGEFRRISVKVDRGDLKLQSRTGYFALPPNVGTNVVPYEMPMLAALNAPALPEAIDFRSSALHFRPSPKGTDCALVIEVPLKNLTFADNKLSQTYDVHFSVMGMIKDPQGTVVKKFSQDVPSHGPLEKEAAVKDAARFIYTRHFDLTPGTYTVEAAVLDREGDNKVGARRSTLVVPDGNGVGLSNIVMVRQFNAQAKPDDPEDPFQFQNGRITPTLMNEAHAAKGSMIPMFLVVYPDPAVKQKPEVQLEFSSQGQSLGAIPLQLPAPDKEGKISYIAPWPVEKVPPGQYDVRAVVKQGDETRDAKISLVVD